MICRCVEDAEQRKAGDFAINICLLAALGGVMMCVPRMTCDVCAAGEATI